MNKREAQTLREALVRLELGPGFGWREALEGPSTGRARSIDERTRDLELWLQTWVTPAIRAVVDRYGGGPAQPGRTT
jgi:hypothetical protein